MKLVVVFAVLLQLTPASGTVATCTASYLQCGFDKAGGTMAIITTHSTNSFSTTIPKCFRSANCPVPAFDRINANELVTDPTWRNRINLIFQFIREWNPSVKDCVSQYFIRGVVKLLEACLRQKNVPVSADFHFKTAAMHLNLDALTKTLYNQMLMYIKMDQCIHHSPAGQERLKQCVGKVKNTLKNDKSLCTGVRECYKSFSSEAGCAAALTRVNTALTQCVAEKTRGKMPKFFTQMTKDFARGEMEQAFKKCHTAAGVPYPADKVDSIKKMIRSIAVDMAKRRGTPESVTRLMHVMNNVMQDVTSQWIAAYSPACIRG